MTRPRLTALLALTCLAWVAAPAVADGPSAAATTSFQLQDGKQIEEVDLVVAREDDRDVLLLRLSRCGDHSCAGRDLQLTLADGQFMITEESASLRTQVDGRELSITWSLAGDGARVSGSRVRSDGTGGQSSADTFAGRTAAAQVQLDDVQCVTSGAIGTSVRIDTRNTADPASLGAGSVACPTE